MDHIYSPWRKEYFDRDKNNPACVFCEAAKQPDSPENLIIFRGKLAFVILNRYPYTSGHLMVVPFQHSSALSELTDDTMLEMMQLTQKAVSVLGQEYQPQGFNIGMNLGAVAGAGITEHLHMHVVPRWQGDANFVSVIGQTRVLPETLEETYYRMRQAWKKA
ncbi:MAG TPA: HIT domain-containing protein [Anaerolineaceae bacterium]|nr:HIT family hydrolase [Anaerolineaceae bacterium]HUM48676.1 HIT domain-containing protein [Anaerolineaceae bacterium]